MTYIATIVGPAGRETFLCRGREVGSSDTATHYAHPSAAHHAIDSYLEKHATLRIAGYVSDPKDPERGTC